ncbi:MAG: lytic murein transglycosylase [Candidatus Parcubacteria bacterium]|nr:lytic murein transglycosylase [Candidatus Parcubacteria bacterium]
MRPDSRADFLTITKELGMDPDTTPISCPLKGVPGWGGAMGPGQFMPKTWMGYKDKIAVINGKPSANPWDIRDAFTGTALYLANFGAKSKTYNGEWRAAMIYFSGSTNVRFRFYGDNVMKLASNYEKDIAEIRAAKQ